MKNQIVRLNISPVGNTSEEDIKKNIKYCKKMKFKKVSWGCYIFPRCAVVGGGESVKKHLSTLRSWSGDIFAMNDAAGYLSKNRIKSYMFPIDGSKIPFKTGKNVKGAVFSTRVNKCQFDQFRHEDIRVFNMAEDDQKQGIEGGPTGLCRTPHLLLQMGYAGIDFFGCEGSFFRRSHNTGDHDDARGNMIVVRVKGIDYLTHAGFMVQNEFMVKLFKEYPKFFSFHCDGLLMAMFENPDTWGVVAVSDSIKEQHEAQGGIYKTPYKFENPIWEARNGR